MVLSLSKFGEWMSVSEWIVPSFATTWCITVRKHTPPANHNTCSISTNHNAWYISRTGPLYHFIFQCVSEWQSPSANHNAYYITGFHCQPIRMHGTKPGLVLSITSFLKGWMNYSEHQPIRMHGTKNRVGPLYHFIFQWVSEFWSSVAFYFPKSEWIVAL